MKLLVTGATGFLGQYIVAEALHRGHTVRAIVRPAGIVGRFAWGTDPKLELARVDLRSKRGLLDAVSGVDVVIHAAAAKSGDFYAQFAGTVLATENLLEAMRDAGVKRLVAISSFSIYDYLRMPSGTLVDEGSPTETDAAGRDEYAQTKLIQEKLVREAGEANGWTVTVLRPGVIWGRGNNWTARIGAGGENSHTWLRIGSGARLPLTYVENCAEAIVLAAERGTGQTLNVVDDEQPTQRKYTSELARRMPQPPRIVPIPWLVMRGLARMVVLVNRVCFRGQAKLPGILIPARLHARFKPLRYSNQRIKDALGWQPRFSLAEGLERSFAQQQALAEESKRAVAA